MQVPVCATLGALHLFPSLPKCMAWVACVCLSVGLVDTGALDEGVEGGFIDSLVDIDATHQAFQVSRCFCKLVLTRVRVFRLLIQEAFDRLRSG